MGSLRVNGSTSGYVDIVAPATAGTNTATLSTATGTIPVLGSATSSGESSSLNINTRPWNMPWGISAYTSSTSPFSTSGTHTTAQDTGLSISFLLTSGRLYKFTQVGNPYNPGSGSAGVLFSITDSANNVYGSFNIDSQAMLPGASLAVTNCLLYAATSTATVTFKVRMNAAGVNAAVTDYGSATQIRLFFAEDMGPA